MTFAHDLFGEPLPPPPSQLVAVAPAGRVLSKTQRAFNRLVARVEKLRGEIKSTTAEFEEALRGHEQLVRPRLDVLTRLRKDVARRLAPFLTDPRLKRPSDRELLARIVYNLIGDAAAHEGGIVDEDLQQIMQEITAETDETDAGDAQSDLAALRAEVERTLGTMGIRVDLSDIPPDADPDEIFARVDQAMHAAREAQDPAGASAQQPRRPRRPTSKQLEREARRRQQEEARQRTIGTIFRQLAKALHPDLEQDPERRRQKLLLMQELTAAHRSNDLHTLLRLELEWLHQEEGDIERLSEEKLAVYNLMLREQVRELEQEHAALRHQPRFLPLAVRDDLFGFRLELNPAARAARLDRVIRSMQQDLERLEGGGTLAVARAILRTVREEQRQSFRTPF